MHPRRILLAAQKANSNGKPGIPDGIDLVISMTKDGLKAAISGQAPAGMEPALVQKAVMALLRKYGIKHGIITSGVRLAIKELCEGNPVNKILLARGQAPVEGQSAVVQMHAQLGVKHFCVMQPEGRISYDFEAEPVMVETGVLLAQISPPVSGQDGIDILGNKIAVPKVRRMRFKTGEGVTLSEDRMSAYAARSGVLLQPGPDRLEVVDYEEISGDVDSGSGPVDSPGVVRVLGGVRKGMRVKCRGLMAREVEPGAVLEVDGDLWVEGGIMGAGLTVSGQVTARYMRDCRVQAGGDVWVENEIVTSQVECKASVKLISPASRVVNSAVTALSGVQCGEVVSSGSQPTSFRIGMTKALEEEIHELRRNYRELRAEQQAKAKQMQDIEVELYNTEAELKELVTSLKDPAQESNKDNLMGQLGMIKPLRDGLREDVASLKQRLTDNFFCMQRITWKLDQMHSKADPDLACLTVMKEAEPSTEIAGPRASLVLRRPESGFSAREQMILDKSTGKKSAEIQLMPLDKSP